jgi:hypothetical protein
MRNSVITLAIDTHRETPMVSKNFEKSYSLISQQCSVRESSKTTEIYTHIANTALAKIKSPLDRFFEDNANDTNMLQK